MERKITTLFIVSTFIVMVIGCSSTQRKVKDAKNDNFTQAQMQLIMSGDTTQPMRVFKITSASDSMLLRSKSEVVNVDPNDPVLQHFVKRLYRTVRDSMSLGVGIAAPQVGILKNIIWVQRFDKENLPFEVYLNPRIVQYSKMKQDCLEGCLSIPNRNDTTQTRAYALLLEYDRMDTTHAIELIEAFTAVIFQHEVDHLNGILYLDHLEKEKKGADHQ